MDERERERQRRVLVAAAQLYHEAGLRALARKPPDVHGYQCNSMAVEAIRAVAAVLLGDELPALPGHGLGP